MTTIATSPTYTVPGIQSQLTVTITGGGANYARVWVTNAPPGSALRAQLDKSTQSRVFWFDTDGGSTHPFIYVFDRGGKYSVSIQEYTKGAVANGGGYENSPGAAQSETKVGSESALTFFVGQRLTSKIGTPKDSGTLVLWVWDDTIRETTLATHHEVSPAVVSPSSPNALAASESTALATSLANLINVAVTTAVGTVATIVAEMVTKINAHEPKVTGAPATHNAADSTSAIPNGYSTATTPADLPQAITAILRSLRSHYTNDNGTGLDSGNYHNPTAAAKVNDWVNMPLFRSVGNLDEGYRALADIWRSYEAHRASTTVHGSADGTNTLTALPKLLLVHKDFLTVLAAASPTTPPTQSSGAVHLMQQAGFVEG